jgi:hypothetical protein
MFLFAVGVGFSALVYMTYRRYVDDVKTTAAKAEQAERERAEQAEQHIAELRITSPNRTASATLCAKARKVFATPLFTTF